MEKDLVDAQDSFSHLKEVKETLGLLLPLKIHIFFLKIIYFLFIRKDAVRLLSTRPTSL